MPEVRSTVKPSASASTARREQRGLPHARQAVQNERGPAGVARLVQQLPDRDALAIPAGEHAASVAASKGNPGGFTGATRRGHAAWSRGQEPPPSVRETLVLNDTPRTFVGATTFHVDGMTCRRCHDAVADQIGRLAGVVEVHIDVATGTVTVTAETPSTGSTSPQQ